MSLQLFLQEIQHTAHIGHAHHLHEGKRNPEVRFDRRHNHHVR